MTLQRSSAATLAPPQVPDSAPTAAATQAVQLTVASRQLDDVPWAPVEDGTAFGLAYSYEGPTLGYELGLQYTSEDDDSVRDVQGVPFTVSLQLETLELYGGVRKTFFEGASIRPYVGAGVTLIQANGEADVNGAPLDSDDVGFGGYVRAGLLVPISDRFRMGLDARLVRGVEFDLRPISNSDSLDADFEQFGLVFEYLV